MAGASKNSRTTVATQKFECPDCGGDVLERKSKKGNVFYDVKYSGRDYTKDGTLFEGERFEHIIKGKNSCDHLLSFFF